MVISILLMTSVFTAAEAPYVFSMPELLANIDKLFEKTLEGNQGQLTVRCQVRSVSSQKATDPSNKTFEEMVLHPIDGESKKASFYIIISPKAKKALKRLGITNLRKHFSGKEIEVRGKLSATYTWIYASPTEIVYHIDITNLKQIRMVKNLSSK